MRRPIQFHCWRRGVGPFRSDIPGGFWVRFGFAEHAPGVHVRWRVRALDYVPFSERYGHVRMRRIGPFTVKGLR